MMILKYHVQKLMHVAIVSVKSFPFLVISLSAFAVFLVLAIFRVFITFFTHQVSARFVIFKLFVDFESKIWTTSAESKHFFYTFSIYAI